MEANYWHRFRATRLTRRRALTATGSVAAAAAFLAACGGDSNKSSSGSSSGTGNSTGSTASGGTSGTGGAAATGLLANPTDQTSTRKRGGTLNIAASVATATLEQSLGGNGSGSALVHSTYSQLMRAKIGTYKDTPQGVWEPEFAKSYEQSADGLTVTFKLRGMKFDNRPPTNGRVSTSADVKYS